MTDLFYPILMNAAAGRPFGRNSRGSSSTGAAFSCMLGGPDRRTLFMLVAEWRGIEQVDEALASRTGQVLIADAAAPGAGWP